MRAKTVSSAERHGVLLIGPKVPPYGGMALQAHLMQRLMNEEGVSAEFLPSNLPFPKRLHFLERLRGTRPFLRSAVFCWELWKMLKRVEVVHILACSWLYFFVIVCPAVSISRLRRKRVILNYRGGQADQFFRWYRVLLRPFFRMADVVTAPSDFLVKVIGKRIGVPVQIVPNIVDFRRFRYRERKPLRPKMVVTRHLEKLYDIESIIRAFGEVQRRYRHACLKIAGTGQQEQALRNLVSDLRLENVFFLGYIPQRDLPPLYDECDILLNASRADNFPGSLVEAAAAGLVVISTGVGGIPHMFENEKSALLVEPGDWAALAGAVLRVVENAEFASQLATEALRQCRRYDWKYVRRLLYPIYGFDLFEDETPSGLEGESAIPELGVAVGRSRLF